jgi:hypothetical protein
MGYCVGIMRRYDIERYDLSCITLYKNELISQRHITKY